MQHQSWINNASEQAKSFRKGFCCQVRQNRAEGKKDGSNVNRKTRWKTERKRRGIQRCLQTTSMKDQSSERQVFVAEILLRQKHTHERAWSGELYLWGKGRVKAPSLATDTVTYGAIGHVLFIYSYVSFISFALMHVAQPYNTHIL